MSRCDEGGGGFLGPMKRSGVRVLSLSTGRDGESTDRAQDYTDRGDGVHRRCTRSVCPERRVPVGVSGLWSLSHQEGPGSRYETQCRPARRPIRMRGTGTFVWCKRNREGGHYCCNINS